jgi:preprotein translocase subunit Sec61beta
MANQGFSMPSSYGGLMRYNEEYKSSITLSPTHVVLLIILIIAFVASMKVFWPIG